MYFNMYIVLTCTTWEGSCIVQCNKQNILDKCSCIYDNFWQWKMKEDARWGDEFQTKENKNFLVDITGDDTSKHINT